MCADCPRVSGKSQLSHSSDPHHMCLSGERDPAVRNAAAAAAKTELQNRITAALDFIQNADDGAGILPHLTWQLDHIMRDVEPSDLIAAEVMVMLAVLVPVHARILAARDTATARAAAPTSPPLRLVWPCVVPVEDSPADLVQQSVDRH